MGNHVLMAFKQNVWLCLLVATLLSLEIRERHWSRQRKNSMLLLRNHRWDLILQLNGREPWFTPAGNLLVIKTIGGASSEAESCNSPL